jgi:hypothetical protein
MSYSKGVDSTAILLRWLTEPASQDFERDALVVIAHAGDDRPDPSRCRGDHLCPDAQADDR